MKKFLSTLILLLITQVVISQNYQDSVLLLNGKSYKCDVIGLEGSNLHFQIKDKKNVVDDYFISDYRIFSFTQAGKESVLYKKNEEIGNFLEVHESKRYAIGAYDARQTYKVPHVFISSLIVGYGVSIWDTYMTKKAVTNSEIPGLKAGFFGKGPTLIPFSVPLLLTASFGLPNIRVRDKHMIHKDYINDQMYYNGFNSYSKQKRAFSALKGGALGVGLGLITYGILKIN